MACAKWGIDVVRRLSGGSAVLHDKELTYSLICSEGRAPFTSNVLETYKIIGECLMATLRSLTLNAKWVTFRDKHNAPTRLNQKTANCFSAPSWYEITIEGKKICGSAQKRGGGVFLQHGSILLDHHPEMLAEVLYSRKSKSELLAEICSTTTSINCHARTKIDFNRLHTQLLESFKEHLGITGQDGEITAYEHALKDTLLKERYRTSEWNLHKRPVNQSGMMRGTQADADSLL